MDALGLLFCSVAYPGVMALMLSFPSGPWMRGNFVWAWVVAPYFVVLATAVYLVFPRTEYVSIQVARSSGGGWFSGSETQTETVVEERRMELLLPEVVEYFILQCLVIQFYRCVMVAWTVAMGTEGSAADRLRAAVPEGGARRLVTFVFFTSGIRPSSKPVCKDVRAMLGMRSNVAREMLSTERSYVASLRRLQQNYQNPLRDAGSSPLLNATQVQAVFSNLDVILNTNAEMLDVLERELAEWTAESRVGHIYLRFAPFMKCYIQYSNNYETSNKTLRSLASGSAKLQQFLDHQAENDPQGLAIEDYLIMPVQRLPRYVLLIREMLKNTPETHPDRCDLEQASQAMESVSAQLNQAMNVRDAQNAVLAFQRRLTGTLVDFVRPWSMHLGETRVDASYHGPFRPRVLTLLTDDLVFCKEISGGKLKFKRLIPVQHLSVSLPPPSGRHNHLLGIVDKRDMFEPHMVSFESDGERMKWKELLEQTRDNQLVRLSRPRSRDLVQPELDRMDTMLSVSGRMRALFVLANELVYANWTDRTGSMRAWRHVRVFMSKLESNAGVPVQRDVSLYSVRLLLRFLGALGLYILLALSFAFFGWLAAVPFAIPFLICVMGALSDACVLLLARFHWKEIYVVDPHADILRSVSVHGVLSHIRGPSLDDCVDAMSRQSPWGALPPLFQAGLHATAYAAMGILVALALTGELHLVFVFSQFILGASVILDKASSPITSLGLSDVASTRISLVVASIFLALELQALFV